MSGSLVFFTKRDCSLCEKGWPVAENLARNHGFSLRKVDIESVNSLLETYGEKIPVLELDGKELGWGRLSARALEREVARMQRSFAPTTLSTEAEERGDWSLERARAAYFEAAELPADGGYDDRWVTLKFAGIPIWMPNTAARIRAVRYHDLHHVLTGYGTDWAGEGEISAWELASGCKDFAAAWILNLFGMAIGLVVAPRRTYRAFLGGLRASNLYGEPFGEELLSRTLIDARRAAGLEAPVAAASTGDRLAFAFWALIALGVAVVPFAALGLAVGFLIADRVSIF